MQNLVQILNSIVPRYSKNDFTKYLGLIVVNTECIFPWKETWSIPYDLVYHPHCPINKAYVLRNSGIISIDLES